jgi:hypothetical protein
MLKAPGLMLHSSTVIEATLIAAPNSTRTAAASATLRCTRPRNAQEEYGMSVPDIAQGAEIVRQIVRISIAGVQIPLKLKPSILLCGIQAIKAISVVSFGHHPQH